MLLFRGRMGWGIQVLVSFLFTSPSFADQVVETAHFSLDIQQELGERNVSDETIISESLIGNGSGLSILELGVPTHADVDAFARESAEVVYFSVDITVDLIDVVAEPGDLVRLESGSYTLEIDASTIGIPPGANLDAVLIDGSAFQVSFDITVELPTQAGTVFVEDEDLIGIDQGIFADDLSFDGSAEGVPAEADLDGAFLDSTGGDLYVSFDISGAVSGTAFDDEDILILSPAHVWSFGLDLSVKLNDLVAGADLDAVAGSIADLIFADGFESGDTGNW